MDSVLVKFRVENYKQFETEQSLSMSAGPSRDHPSHVRDIKGDRILRTAAIFGSNASGKTNLIRAMAVSREKIVSGFQIDPMDYCRTDPGNKERPTAFEYVIELDGAFYAYGFEVMLTTGVVTTEWLNNISGKGKAMTVFSRRMDEIVYGPSLTQTEEKYFFVYSNEVRQDKTRLLLSTLSRMPDQGSGAFSAPMRVFRWFRDSLRFIGAGQPSGFSPDTKIGFSGRMIPRYGSGVTGIGYERMMPDESLLPKEILDNFVRMGSDPGIHSLEGSVTSPQGMFVLRMNHGGEPDVEKVVFDHGEITFDYREESEGTGRLMELLPVLDDSDTWDRTYVIDELDRSLHPQLTQKLIRDFGDLSPELKRQLIVTTHESRIMDLNLLRRDEIWFVEKGSDGTSSVYSLESFNERKDRRIDRAYLDGRYGAVPCFKAVFPDME